MSSVALFAVGSIVFMFLTWATLMFLYLRFNDVYRNDQADTGSGAKIMVDGNVEMLEAPKSAAS